MRTLRIVPRVFAAVGLLALLIAVWVNSLERRFVATAERATGTVVDLEYRSSGKGGAAYYPVIRFVTRSGDTVVAHTNVGARPPAHQKGDVLPILYDPARPLDAKTTGFFSLYVGSFVAALFALIFGGVGGTWIAVQRRAAAIEEELRQTGQRVEATVVEVELRTNLRVNGRHPYRIVAQRQDPVSHEVQVFRSANIWFDPTAYVPKTVQVLVDRYNPRRHLVDLGFLPKVSD